MRPIVLQIGTITYETAKWLNFIITKYMNQEYKISSTYEYIELIKTCKNPKMLASLDVENLFTNVPVTETIEIICNKVYNHSDIPLPKIPRESMENLLIICTTKTPFRSPNGEIYLQTDSVSMGTPLGPTFANFYASNLEETVLKNDPSLKPPSYCRCMDDIFPVIDKYDQFFQIEKCV